MKRGGGAKGFQTDAARAFGWFWNVFAVDYCRCIAMDYNRNNVDFVCPFGSDGQKLFEFT